MLDGRVYSMFRVTGVQTGGDWGLGQLLLSACRWIEESKPRPWKSATVLARDKKRNQSEQSLSARSFLDTIWLSVKSQQEDKGAPAQRVEGGFMLLSSPISESWYTGTCWAQSNARLALT